MIDCTTQILADKDRTEKGEAPSTGMMSVLAMKSWVSPETSLSNSILKSNHIGTQTQARNP